MHNNMPAKLQKKFSKLVYDYDTFLQSARNLSYSEFNTPLKKGKWSAAQIFLHLNASMQNTTAYINKKIQYPETIQKNRLSAWARAFFLNAVLRTNYKMKAPKGLDVFAEETSYEKIEAQWTKIQANLKTMLDSFPESLRAKNVFRHPYAGRITLSQTLTFMSVHIHHHKRQVEPFLKQHC